MDNFLANTVVLLGLIVSLGFFNEKVTKLTYEISLMLFSSIIGIALLFVGMAAKGVPSVQQALAGIQIFNAEKFLMDGILCFMLFAGSCHMRFLDFKKNARSLSVLAMGATLLGAVIYGVLFYLVVKLLGQNIPLAVCLLFGSIIAPTDPIAATSILKKFGLPKGVSFLMEGESLFNDGVGVALFVCFSGLVTASGGGGFFMVMGKELLGAVVVGILAAALGFLFFSRTKDDIRRIFASLFAVSLAYFLCEAFGFSGAIASVVCGLFFSNAISRGEKKGNKLSLEQYDTFWEILDNLFNSLLYVILGLTFVRILETPYVLILSFVAIVLNLIGRSGSISIATLITGPLPDGYDRLNFVKLLTWGGLRGGLSVALAMSTGEILDTNIYHVILGGTYAIVFFTTVVQGLTMKRVYGGIKKKVENKNKTGG